MRHNDMRRSSLLFVAAVLLGGCSIPGLSSNQQAKVDVDTIPTDIVFGVPKPGAPGQAQPLTAPTEVPVPALEQPTNLTFTPSTLIPTSPSSLCPTAPATAFPAEVAGSDVNSMPAEGQYRWAASGEYDLTVLTTPIKLPLPTLQTRYVRRPVQFQDPVPTVPGSPPPFDFTYQTIEPRNGQPGLLLFYWQVKMNAFNQTASGSLAGGPTVNAGDPEAGLTLKEVDTMDASGNTTQIFKGNPGLLLLPLPVQPGVLINQQSVDSSASANNLQFSGTVGNRERVDACGEPIQAWAVDGTLTPSGAGAAAPAKLHFDVATQYGALIVAFNIVGDGSYFNTMYHNAKARIGQVKPGPLPDKYK